MSAKKQLEWSIQASDDLADIYDAIVDDNPKAAAQVNDFIIKAVVGVMSNPLIGREGIKRNTRELVLSRYPYTVVYRVNAQAIRIVTVLHQSKLYP